ncbi:MAG: class I mannose-6-phosphate isomerase [Bacteroidales bacterium]|nr:class I mannose-6-phosphate isomerase [Bacteroidales bacterium]
MTDLYPLKFEPQLKKRMWGGSRLSGKTGESSSGGSNIGESWVISGIEGAESVVANGYLAGNNLSELVEVYMGDIAGEAVFEKFGNEFPLLVKYIDAASTLSVQVHPGDEMAARLHHAYGKTEMWYIMDADPGAMIYCGFKDGTDEFQYKSAVVKGTIENLLNAEPAKKGDIFLIPAGMVHAIGGGILLAEIQQPSDVTYRIFDWNRTDEDGNPRELHTELAAEAIDFKARGGRINIPSTETNKTTVIVNNRHFTTGLLSFDAFITKDYNLLDSFVILLCTSGEFVLHYDAASEIVSSGETIMIPAMVRDVVLEPRPAATVLEIYLNTTLTETSN